MQLLETLENRIDKLLRKINELEEENSKLKSELDREKETKQIVSKRLDNLLQKIEEVDIT